MTRFSTPDPEALSDVQREVYDATRAGRRGTVPANVLAWLPSPEFASRAQALGAFVRYGTSLPPRLSELAILVVARHWTAHYEWAIHAPEAARAGVGDAVIAAIAAGRTPAFDVPDEHTVHAFAAALVATGRVPDAEYCAALAALGQAGVVELAGLVGYYTLVAMTLNVFEVPPPPGAPVLPPR